MHDEAFSDTKALYLEGISGEAVPSCTHVP